MCEVPSNAILAEEFLRVFDGFSIGSNDLTQLTLGLDRDSGTVAHLFDERNDAVRWLIARAIEAARRAGQADRHLRPGAVGLSGIRGLAGGRRDRFDLVESGRRGRHDDSCRRRGSRYRRQFL